ncbi:hypothetical protein BCR41DRAFT_355081 [Lobosporangium transversale]|uniref:Uncharacterized protein n=1 Tax=Lobosporangium transversale TaxID=64571 RepID=A0A1Y2GPV5_9FUNG|nr:hypothetical protein BCR41DRAFT_355081 [Lobosporangium transversale]ORZ13859.1 hypothetical protein BCR41DRAFT_355081 [Lobosporangium transversale]|eukprot:XP_021880643.1 hypothetical protein BCR41DRAFT_355081 [Lobosporangium transversale]
MVDHRDHSPQPYPSTQRHHLHPNQQPQQPHHQRPQPHQQQRPQHQHLQPPHHYHYSRTFQGHHHNQDIQGPLSAGVIEGHQRAFAFPTFHSSSLHSRATRPTPPSPPMSHSNLSVSDILERYQDASQDFLVSILNAKAKEDERKKEEERYKTEQVRLQYKQLELELALEKRRGSPPAGRMYASNGATETGGGSANYTAPSPPHRPSYPIAGQAGGPSESTHSHQYGRPHDHSAHAVTDSAEQQQQQQPSSIKHGSTRRHPYQSDTHHMQPSPQSRPPSLKINTAVRQSFPKHRVPVSPTYGGPASAPPTTLAPLSLPYSHGGQSNKGSSSARHHYTLPALSSVSAHSSPVANIDYQSQIPPPITPKEEHVSPTSILSPAVGQNLKRKSIHHEAVMDAVRAKVMRNAEQNQLREREQQHLQKKASLESANRRKAQHQQSSSPERSKKAVGSYNNNNNSNTSSTSAATAMTSPKSKHSHASTASPSKQSPPHSSPESARSEGPQLAPIRHSESPASPSTPTSANAGSGPSRSSSPHSAKATTEASKATNETSESVKSSRRGSHPEYARASAEDEDQEMTSPTSKYEMDRTRPDQSEIGVLAV